MILITITIFIGFILWFIAGYRVGKLHKKQNDLINKYLNKK